MLAPVLLRREGWPKRQACVGTAPISAAPASTRSPAELVGFTVAARALGRRARGGGEKERRWWTALDEEIFGVWPPAVANLLLPALVGSVDLFWIGRSGDAIKIAGMGATNQVFNTIYFLISFLPTIVTPRVAEEWAQQRRDGAAQWVTDAMSFAALLGLVGTVALVGFPHSTLRLVADSPDVLQQAVPYCWIRGCSLTATLCSSVSFAAFRALLDFKTPLKVALATNAVNALLDPLLMHWMGVSGVALATTLAEISGAVSLAVLLRRKKLLRGFRMPAVDALKTFLQNGPAVQVRSASTNLMFLLAVRRITRIDPTGVQAAAYQVSQQFWNLAGHVSLALSTSAAGLVPNKYFREGGVEDARRLADRLYLWGACLGVLLCVLQLLCLPLVSMYTPIKAVQRAARAPAILAALLQLMNGVVFAGEGILLGLKAYGWLACGSGFGCALMVTCLYLFGDDALTGFWVGIYFFNFTRLVASLSHRLRFGPLARRSTG